MWINAKYKVKYLLNITNSKFCTFNLFFCQLKIFIQECNATTFLLNCIEKNTFLIRKLDENRSTLAETFYSNQTFVLNFFSSKQTLSKKFTFFTYAFNTKHLRTAFYLIHPHFTTSFSTSRFIYIFFSIFCGL